MVYTKIFQRCKGWENPTNTTHLANVWPMLAHRLRRWPNIGQTLARCVVFAGKFTISKISPRSLIGFLLRYLYITRPPRRPQGSASLLVIPYIIDLSGGVLWPVLIPQSSILISRSVRKNITDTKDHCKYLTLCVLQVTTFIVLISIFCAMKFSNVWYHIALTS